LYNGKLRPGQKLQILDDYSGIKYPNWKTEHVGTYINDLKDNLSTSYLIILWLRNFQFLWPRGVANSKMWTILELEIPGNVQMDTNKCTEWP